MKWFVGANVQFSVAVREVGIVVEGGSHDKFRIWYVIQFAVLADFL
jgi:hypothetical protein